MLVHEESSGGREVKVYDPARQPRNWNELLARSQCAVFFKRIDSEAPLSPSGATVARFRDCTFLLFDSLEEARRVCEAKVRDYPFMRCEIFDWRGKAQPPLLTIVHPDIAQKDELSAQSVRRRKILAIFLFIAAVPLFVLDHRSGGFLVLPTFLGLTMILAGLRLLYWNTARRQRLKEEEQGVRAHLEREQQNDQNWQSTRRPGN
jgi:hypothetical protein